MRAGAGREVWGGRKKRAEGGGEGRGGKKRVGSVGNREGVGWDG